MDREFSKGICGLSERHTDRIADIDVDLWTRKNILEQFRTPNS